MRPRIALLVLTLACVATTARAQTVVFGVGGQLSAPLDERFVAPVYVDLTGAPGTALGSFTVRITWNRDSLSYYGGSGIGLERGAFGGTLAVNTDSAYYGVLKVAGASSQGVQGVADLFGVPMYFYYYYGGGTTAINIQVTEASAAGTFANLLPFVTTLSGVACPAVGRWGDLDQDGRANSRDALAILSSVVGLSVPGFNLALGDVDGDGLANSRDALILLSYAVGIDIAGQRVLLVAPGACVAPEVPQVAILPDTVDLVLGQQVRPVVVPTDAGGTPTAVTVLSWAVDDPEVAAMVDETGLMVGRKAGTTVLRAALGPGVIITAPVVVRDRRGTWHVDMERALGQPVQLGTQKYPLESPNFAFPAVAEGDTIRFSPGTHEWNPDTEDDYNLNELYVGVVFIGDTLADGTRPIVRGPTYRGEIRWYGGASGRIQDLVLQNTFLFVSGLRNLHTENVRFEFTDPDNVIYVYSSSIDTLSIVNTEFVSPTVPNSGYGVSVWDGAGFVRLHDSRFTRFNASVYLYDVDSLDVRRNEFRYTDVALGSYSYSGQTRPYSTAVVIDNVVDSAGLGLWASADSVIMTDNVLTRITENGLAVEEAYGRGGTGMVIARNQVSCEAPLGGPYGIQVYGVPGTLEDNTITACRSFGIYVSAASGNPLATVPVRRNRVTMPENQTGYGMYLNGRFGLVTMYGNTVRNGSYGVYYAPHLNTAAGDTTRLVADSNAISGTGYTALHLGISASYTGSVVGVRNNISNNQGYGVYTSFDGPQSLTLGRFVGNGGGGTYVYAIYTGYAFDATQNWWGDPAGAGGGIADSVYYAPVINTGSPLTADPTNVPPTGPPGVSARSLTPTPAAVARDDIPDRRAAIHERVKKVREEQELRQRRRQ
jgi:hypothetical protein